jgi:hypothetical protein
MYVHATGTIPDLDKLEPYRPEERRVLAELHAEGVVKNLLRLSDRPGVYLIGAAHRSRCGQPLAWPSWVPPRDSRACHGQALRWGSVLGVSERRENHSDLIIHIILAS